MTTEPEVTEQIDDDFNTYFNEITVDQPKDDQAPAQAAPDDAFTQQPESEESAPAEEPRGTQDTQEPHESHASPDSHSSQDDKTPEELEALRKKAHGYDSMLGRLQAEQRARQQEQQELARARDELARMRGHAPAPVHQDQQVPQGHGNQPAPQHVAPTQPAAPLSMVEIPEDIKEEAEAFSRDYPDLTPLLRYPGREGEKLRKLLAEYGPDVAALHGQNVMSQYRMSQAEQQMAQRLSQAEMAAKQAREESLAQVEHDRKARHYAEIGSQHPEVQWMFDPRKQQDYAAFRRGLDEWVMDRPMREAQYVQQVLAQGTATDVSAILSAYKQSQANGNGNGADHAAQQAAQQSAQQQAQRHQQEQERARLAQAASAVPGRHHAPRPGGQPPPDDFSSAWQEAVRQ